MDAATVREALRAQPFRPFSIRLADGRNFPVPPSEFAAMSQRNIHVVREDGSYSILDLLLISSLDFEEDSQSSRRKENGRE